MKSKTPIIILLCITLCGAVLFFAGLPHAEDDFTMCGIGLVIFCVGSFICGLVGGENISRFFNWTAKDMSSGCLMFPIYFIFYPIVGAILILGGWIFGIKVLFEKEPVAKKTISQRCKDLLDNKDQYIFLCTEEDAGLGARVSSTYSELSICVNEYLRDMTDSGMAAAGTLKAYQTHKIDPYIAGGAAQSIGGVSAGVYTALSAADRNKKIDEMRTETARKSEDARFKASYSEKKLLEVVEQLEVLLDSSEAVKQYRINRERRETEKDEDRKEERQKAHAEKRKTRRLKIKKFALMVIIVVVAIGFLTATVLLIKKNIVYNNAVTLMNGNDVERSQAGEMFSNLGHYRDSEQYLSNYICIPDHLTQSSYDVLNKARVSSDILIKYNDSFRIDQIIENIHREYYSDDADKDNQSLRAFDLVFDDQGRLIQFSTEGYYSYKFYVNKIYYDSNGLSGRVEEFDGHYETGNGVKVTVIDDEPKEIKYFDENGNYDDTVEVDNHGNPIRTKNNYADIKFENEYSKNGYPVSITYEKLTGKRTRNIHYNYVLVGKPTDENTTQNIIKALKIIRIIY